MGTVRSLTLHAVKLTAGAFDLVVPARPGATILLYHRVGSGTGSQVDLPAALFRRQIAAVAASGRASTLGQALSWLAADEPPGPPPLVVTFDDGTSDVIDTALPILVEHQVPATLYVATAFVEDGRLFPGGALPASWNALADACSTGMMTVGSHTHDHLLLDRVDEDVAVQQLDRSRSLIEDRLGTPAEDFAYPKALAPSPAVARLVKQRFRSAALAGGGVNTGGTDPQRLARVPIQNADGMRWFARKLDGGLALEGRLRFAANRMRYAGSTT
jgi:peptidoglycan/xylan/chitin deacetylase (PgdA/CDA1 family)